MSAKPRSVLKKRAGTHDDRRVSFAIPLSSDKGAPQIQVATPSSCPAQPKKSKPAEEVVDIITLGNQQSDILENMIEVERKFEKQSDMLHEMTNELATVAEQVSEHSKLLSEAEAQRDALLAKCVQLEKDNSLQAQIASDLSDVEQIVSSINRSSCSDLDEMPGHYDRLFTLIDRIIAAL